MAGGELQRGGSILQAVGFVLNFLLPGAGQALGAFGQATAAILKNVGGIAIGVGNAAQIAGPFITPLEADTPSVDRRQSPAYRFDAPRNPAKGDAPYPIPFGRARVVGPVLAQYATPKGLEADEDFGKVVKNDGQSVSVLMAVSGDEIQAIDDVLLNGESLYHRFEDANGDPRQIGTGNGSKTKFDLPGKRIELDSVRVFVDGTEKGFTVTQRTSTFLVRSGVKLYEVRSNERIDFSRGITVTLAGVELDGTQPENFGTIPGGGEGSASFFIWTQTQWTVGQSFSVAFYAFATDGCTISEKRVIFDTAPAAGAVVTATFLRKTYPGVTIHRRLGTRHQLPIPGFHEVKQEYGLGNQEIVQGSDIQFTTTAEVDDVRLTISSLGPFLAQDTKGRRNPAQANFRIDYKKADESDSAYVRLPDPAGAKQKPENKAANEFRFVADVTVERTLHLSIRGLLDQLVKKRNSSTVRTLRENWTRSKYTFRIRRTNKVKGETNPQFADRIYLVSRTEVRDVLVSFPGVGLIGFHGVGSKKLNGAFPLIEAAPVGLRNVEKYNGTAWVQDDDAHLNPVWADVEMLTNRRWGGGHQFTKADNIDAASAKAAAEWCDQMVTLAGTAGTDEVRARFDAVLDTRSSLEGYGRDALLPAQVIPVWQGAVRRYVIDWRVDLDAVPVYTSDPGTTQARRMARISGGRDSKSEEFTELEAVFWDEEEDYKPRQVFVPSPNGTTNRVLKRMELFGCARRSQAGRIAKHLHKQAVSGGVSARMTITLAALRHEAGDVFGVTCTDAGITTTRYFRCTRITWPSVDSALVEIEAREYVPAAYGQVAVGTSTPRTTPATAPTFRVLPDTLSTTTRSRRETGSGTGRLRMRRRA